MPELPEVQALTDAIAQDFSGQWIHRADLGSLSALKTYDPPLSQLGGATLLATSRRGKFLVLEFADTDGLRLDLVIHLSRAGWIHWRKSASTAPLRPGKGPVALRLIWMGEAGDPAVLDITEAGTQKRLALYVVRDPDDVEGITRLGPDALACDGQEFAEILRAQGKRQLKTVLREQSVISGIGNAYSDEILHAARLSPYAPADTVDTALLHEVTQSVLQEALRRARSAPVGTMKAEKREGLRVHGRTGEPCDVCGTPIAEVRLADSSFQYCPACQTGGKPLADRRMSRLLK